ncbi:hypothetical protein DL98DRAFT_428425, partial [Cadophora sp. DSE1049]
KINKYYNIFDKTPVYITALVLYLSRKWRYIKKHWETVWVALAKAAVKEFVTDILSRGITCVLALRLGSLAVQRS